MEPQAKANIAAVRERLKAFEPIVPPHVMSELQEVVDRYVADVERFQAQVT